jgi:cytoskeletal protein CcmA (bactofilin family)/anti-sigma factor RsiW
MNCFPELTYSIYVDGELPLEEARLVETHLFVCPSCRALVDALRVESLLLADVLQTTEAERTASAGRLRPGLDPLWKFGGMCGLAAAFVTSVEWLSRQFPSTAEWVNPLNRTTMMNLLWTVALYLADEGANMLHLLISTLGGLILGALIAGAAFLLFRRRTVSVGLLASLALVLGLAQPASAIETRRGAKIDVASNETVDGTLLTIGDTLTIEGVVNGDLITFSRRVAITGSVKGDVICFTHNLELDGNVEGNVYTVAQALTIRGTLARNLYGWGQTLQLERGARVSSDAVVSGAALDLSGTVGRDVTFAAGAAEVRGDIGRNVLAAAGNVTLASTARVGGDLTAHVDRKEQVQIDPGATVRGKTEIKLKQAQPSRYTQGKFYFWQGVRLGAALLTGLVLFWLFPLALGARVESGGSVLRAVGIGFLVLVATPIAAVIVGITLVGLPVALLALATWVAGLYLAKVFVAALVGQSLIKSPVNKAGSFALALLLGLFLVFVAMNLPYLGRLIGFLVLLLGLGLAFVRVHGHWHRATPAA